MNNDMFHFGNQQETSTFLFIELYEVLPRERTGGIPPESVTDGTFTEHFMLA
jgi:hypothetical protein